MIKEIAGFAYDCKSADTLADFYEEAVSYALNCGAKNLKYNILKHQSLCLTQKVICFVSAQLNNDFVRLIGHMRRK